MESGREGGEEGRVGGRAATSVELSDGGRKGKDGLVEYFAGELERERE